MRLAVESGQVELTPEHYNKTYFHWIDNLRDWCISRQIWYGHQIPVWYKRENGATESGGAIKHDGKIIETYCDVLSPKDAGRTDADEFIQDEDTLDTWFSSGLWTFSTQGWPNAFDTKTGEAKTGSDLAHFHPTNLLITGPDIIFFWVARMILMTGYTIGTVPFKKVYFNGLVRDMKGQKMSKSSGNGGDPVEISEKYGADALRMFYAMATAPGTDSKLDETKIKGFKHFANKLWNITRFILTMEVEQAEKMSGTLQSNTTQSDAAQSNTMQSNIRKSVQYNAEFSEWSPRDVELITERDEIITTITKELEEYRYHLASDKIYQYTWSQFADIILEESKTILNSETSTVEEKISRIQFLSHTLRKIITITHPFMPLITEELWHIINTKKSLSELSPEDRAKINPATLLMAAKWPN